MRISNCEHACARALSAYANILLVNREPLKVYQSVNLKSNRDKIEDIKTIYSFLVPSIQLEPKLQELE
jgi:hypothetical protein